MRAAHASAETAKVPVVTLPAPGTRRRTQVLFAAAAVAAVGATALTLGAMSSTSTPVRTAAVQPTVVVEVENAVAISGASQDALAANLHDELAVSLPRVQAATEADGMREGSGLFVTPNGHIVTSAGLISDAEYVLVWTDDGRRWEASTIAADPFSDVAVLQIDSDEWPAIPIGSGRSLRSGQYALAIDYANGTMSVGAVSSVSRTVVVDAQSAFIRVGVDQPTALPGSAIIDDAGFVIGMATSDGGSLATPAWMIERVALDLITRGETTHAWLGLTTVEGTGLRQLTIAQVATDSPAAVAGLRVGDRLHGVNGAEIIGDHSLWNAIETSHPGDPIEILFSRFGDQHIVTITLEALAAS